MGARILITATLLFAGSLVQGDEAPATRAREGAGASRYLAVLGEDSPRLERALQPLLEHRRAEGLQVETLVAPGGADARQALRAAIAERAPAYLLLVGDVDRIPAFEVAKAATDRPYGDLDDDGFPEAAIGRFPSSDPRVVARLVARTVAYERARDGGAWRKQCALVAGEARFSPMIDAIIEDLFRRIVSESLAPRFDVDLTYANPNSAYCYPPERFAARVVERLNEGALVCAYVGHGSVTRVDELTVPAKAGKVREYPVLEASHARRLRARGRAPIFVAIACWTGRYEGEQACIGEQLLAAKEGPVAFFGSSRVSHPIHNALLAKELIREFYAEGAVRLGPALDRARRAMVQGRPGEQDLTRLQVLTLAQSFVKPGLVEREMPRHVDMYNLLGDPALRLALPEEQVSLELPARAGLSGRLRVRGRVPGRLAEQVELTLEVPRGQSSRPAPRRERPLARYRRMNDPVLLREAVTLDAEGRFEFEFELPAGLAPGEHWVKAFASGPAGCAAGAQAVQLEAPAPE